MKSFAAVVIVILCLACSALAEEEEEKYSDKYDYIDIDGVLTNDRLRGQYYQCFMDAGPCATPDAQFFKVHIPEAIVTKCKKCTEFQKVAFDKIAIWYNENEPEKWEAVVRKSVDDFQRKAAANKKSSS